MNTNIQRVFYGGLIIIVIFLIMCGCAQKRIAPVYVMDDPEHHYYTGCALLEQGRPSDALDEFKRSAQLNLKYSPAQTGIGLALTELGDFDGALVSFENAKETAESEFDKTLYYTGMIQFYTKCQRLNWLEKAERHFKQANKINPSDPEPYFYMASAYKTAGDYPKASEYFEKVMALNHGYLDKSNREWEEIQKIERAMPGTNYSKKIAKLKSVTRADTAALFVEELDLLDLFHYDIAGSHADLQDDLTDYQDHVLKKDIKTVISIGLRGLEPECNRFYPDRKVSRADFAVMIEDIMVRITGEEDVPVRYIGSPSPFNDVSKSHYAYNAILTCTTRGILSSDSKGYFQPTKEVSGSDAVLALIRLKGIIETGHKKSIQQ